MSEAAAVAELPDHSAFVEKSKNQQAAYEAYRREYRAAWFEAEVKAGREVRDAG